MSNSSPAPRVRSGSIRLGLLATSVAFLFIEGYALQDQLEIGHASAMFMLRTLLAAGFCVGLFVAIAVIGLVASVFFSERPPRQSQEPSGRMGPVDYSSNPRIFPRIKSDAIRRPTLVSKGKRHFRTFSS